MNYLFFDLIILAALVLFTLQGRKRGFVLTLCGFLAVFVAFFGALIISETLSAPVARLIQPVLETSITETLREKTDESRWQLDSHSSTGDEAQTPQLPLSQALEALEDTKLYRTFGQSLREALDQGLLKATSSAAAAIAGYLAREIARLVLFIVAFVVVLLGWTLLSRALDLAFRLPVLSSLNRGFGAAMGFVKGALVVFIAAWLLKGTLLSQEAVEQTFLLRFFCENSPLSLLSML